jgi:hypothetical protein
VVVASVTVVAAVASVVAVVVVVAVAAVDSVTVVAVVAVVASAAVVAVASRARRSPSRGLISFDNGRAQRRLTSHARICGLVGCSAFDPYSIVEMWALRETLLF